MQYTLRALIEPLGGEERLDAICRMFSSMVRTSYNLLLGCKPSKRVILVLQERYGVLNWRWCQWAAQQAQATVNSQRMLLPLYATMYEEKIANIKRKAKRVVDPLRKRGYQARITKLERRRRRIEGHLAAGTVPPAVFGSRRLLESLSKRKDGASKEEGLRWEWRRRRSSQFLSIGQANQRGNANTRITKLGGSYELEVRNWPGGDFKVRLHVPDYYRRLLDAALSSGVAYAIRVVKQATGRYQALASFEVDENSLQGWNERRIAGVDVNPEGLAVTIAAPDGNVLASRWLRESALVYARAGKRCWLASNLAKRALRWVKGYGCNAVVAEKLRFPMTMEDSHHVNRLKSNFLRKKLVELIKVKALKLDWVYVEADASYSSTAGLLKYGEQFPNLNRHQLAAHILARRALGYGENLGAEQAKQIPKRGRVYALRTILSFQGHRHAFLMPRLPADGRIGSEDAKGTSAVTERVTPHTATTSRKQSPQARVEMPRLSLVMLGGGCRGDEPRARGHRVNPPPPQHQAGGVKLGSTGNHVDKTNNVNRANVF